MFRTVSFFVGSMVQFIKSLFGKNIMEGDDSIQGKPLWYCAAKGRPEINKENHSENS